MNTSNIIFGILIIVIGIYAIALNRYPGKDVSYENALKKYKTVNARKLVIFDGGFCIVFGLAYMSLKLIFLIIIFIGYFPLREVLLKYKVI